MNENPTSHAIIGAAIEVHRHLGPGLLESVYESALAYELSARELEVQRQVELPLNYKHTDWMATSDWTSSSRTA
jgi:GxxExxY protein